MEDLAKASDLTFTVLHTSNKHKTGVQLSAYPIAVLPFFYVASAGTILSIMAVASDLKSKSG